MANRSKFNIPCDETARELKKQKKAHAVAFGIESLDQIPEFQGGIMFPTVVDVYGPSGSGKTEILLHLCVHSTCPRFHEGIHVGGNEGSILFFCMGQTPGECMPRLITLFDLCARKAWAAAQQALSPYSPPSDPTESWIESLVLGSLSRVHFVSCSGTLQFLASAHCAETLIKSEPDMSAIIIDCLSAFQVLLKFDVSCQKHNP